MPDQQTSRRGNRRPDLLAAARTLFFERGYNGTPVELVARTAGFSKRTVYLNFRNKDDLFLSVAEEGLVLLRGALEEIDTDQDGVESAITSLVRIYLDFARTEPHYFRMIFQEATPAMISNIPEEFRARIEEHERACLGVVVSVVEQGIAQGLLPESDPWGMAAIFWGAVTGIVLLSMGGSQTVFNRKSREELVERAVRLIYLGLRGAEPEVINVD